MAKFNRITVLTGAGISAESGIQTFRGAGGLWEGERIEDVATPEAYARDPARVLAFYNNRRNQLQSPAIAPNPAHTALAELQLQSGLDVCLITQNVDNLHERGGSTQVWHMHGELLRQFCTQCGADSPCMGEQSLLSQCSHCQTTGSLRPDIVWFGEMPKYMEQIDARLSRTDLFIAIGTSGLVYPAAGFVSSARYHGAHCIEVNAAATDTSDLFHQHWVGPAGTEVPRLVQAIKAGSL